MYFQLENGKYVYSITREKFADQLHDYQLQLIIAPTDKKKKPLFFIEKAILAFKNCKCDMAQVLPQNPQGMYNFASPEIAAEKAISVLSAELAKMICLINER